MTSWHNRMTSGKLHGGLAAGASSNTFPPTNGMHNSDMPQHDRRSQSPFHHQRRLVGLLTLAFVLGSCANGRLDTTKPKGENADLIYGTLRLSGYMAAAVGVLVTVAVVFVMLRFRARPDHDPDELPKQIHGDKRLELAWTVAPVILLVILAVVTVPKIFDLAEVGSGRTIKVEGQQWWWQFSYDTDGDGEYDDIVTANEIVLPVGEDVNLEIHSNDVIHSFWVPQLNGKKDAVPGRVHDWKISSDEPGIYYGECVEFCGLSHANMQVRAIVLSQSDYDAWAASQELPSEIPSSGAAAEGFEVFAANCVQCHIVNNSDERFQAAAGGTEKLLSGVAPNLTHLMSRTSFAGALFELYNEDGSLNVADLREWIRDAPDNKPLNPDNLQGMTSFKDLLSETDLDNLIAYLQTLGNRPILPS